MLALEHAPVAVGAWAKRFLGCEKDIGLNILELPYILILGGIDDSFLGFRSNLLPPFHDGAHS
jgi:hypothetical protein